MISFIVILSFLGLSTGQSVPETDPELRMIIERLNYDQVLPYDNEKIHLPGLIMELYQYAQFEEIWDNDDQISALIEVLKRSKEHGLNPKDYHVDFLVKYYDTRNEDSHLKYYYDLLLSDATFFYSHHLTSGRIDRKYAGTWNYPARENYLELIEVFYDHVKAGNMAIELENQRPELALYDFLMDERRKLTELSTLGDFAWIPGERTIQPGDTFQYLPEVSKRIQTLGYATELRTETVYGEALQKDVENFQKHHGLDVDGVIGKGTFDMLNLRIRDRQDIIDVNLERLRWAASATDVTDGLVVNIAGFHLYYFRDDELYWDTDVMTGAIDTQTPVFVSDMKYLVFNPTWTVPRSIIRNSMFNRIKNDQAYLKNHNYYLVDNKGNRVDENTIDWSTMTINKFAYNVVQSPGPRNALGRVKFIFPNKYAIYLHDTPSRHLFSRTSRAFSHGCIRVKNPLEFAEILLDDKEGYAMDDINKIIQDGKTKTVFLTEPLRVMLIYLTVDDTQDSSIVYHPDIYKRDQAVLELLRQTII